MLEFSKFYELVKNRKKLPVSIYKAVNNLRKTGLSEREIFESTAILTGVVSKNENVYIENLARNRGSKRLAAAIYYWLHVECPDNGYAQLIDEELFQESLRHYFSNIGEESKSLDASPGGDAEKSFGIFQGDKTSKNYDDCQPLRDLAQYLTGRSLEVQAPGKEESFFSKYHETPGWFTVINLPPNERAEILWSAVNTLGHAASGTNLLTPREAESLILFVLDHTADIPDAHAPIISRLLHDIRSALIPRREVSEFSEFRFWRAYKDNPHVRRLRMIQKEPVTARYQVFTEALYHQHETALETLVHSRNHFDENDATFAANLAMGLSSVIHALAIDPRNGHGIEHPYMGGWMRQLEEIAQDHPEALTHLVFARLQIASLSPQRSGIVDTLGELIELYITAGLTHVPLFKALQMNMASVGDSEKVQTVLSQFLKTPDREQVNFITRCNVGILPDLRDRFVAHHIREKTTLMPIVRARFGSSLR